MRISDWSSDVCSSDLIAAKCPRIGRRYRAVAQRVEESRILARAGHELFGPDIAAQQTHRLIGHLFEVGICLDARGDAHALLAAAPDTHRGWRHLDPDHPA